MAFYWRRRIRSGEGGDYSGDRVTYSNQKPPYPTTVFGELYETAASQIYAKAGSVSGRYSTSYINVTPISGGDSFNLLYRYTRTGFPAITRVTGASGGDYVPWVVLDEVTLPKGKYRFKSNIVAYPYTLHLGTVTLTAALNNKVIRGVFFYNTTYSWTGSMNYDHTGTAAFENANRFGAYFVYPEKYEEPTDMVQNFTVDGSVELRDEYKNMVWELPYDQIVPSSFYTWFTSVTEYVYPYTFTVKAQNGVNILTSLVEAPAMVDATPSAVGNVKTLTMTGVNGQTYTMTWESETPAGKQFLGLAYGANETRASIPTGRTTPVTWDGSLTIYEAYGTYRPPVTTFDINLYQSSAEVNRVDKTDFLTGVGTLSGVLREECSIIAPSITFKQTTVPSFNYVYIAAFGRYYYVTGITSVSKDIWRMSLSCDVLMTWKDDIRALTAIIARQENSFNPLLLDSELPAQANQNITVTEFPAGGFSTAGVIEHPFLLTVVGA